MPFVDLSNTYVPLDRDRLKQAIFDALAQSFPGWEAAPGNLETVLVEQLASIAADLADVAVDVPPEIFRGFGQKIAGVAPQLAASATVTSTWTMIDTAGYTIPAGTPVQALVTGSEALGLFTLQETTVPVGASEATGVVLIAAVAGADPNGLSGLTLEPLDNLTFVDAVTMTGTLAGGADEEDPVLYLDRLADELRLLSPRPILPEDFAILARRVPGVWRATAIDGYDPTGPSSGNERMVSVAAVDTAGAGVDSGVRTAIDALLEAERETNFVVWVIEPTVTQIKVSTVVTAMAGYDAGAVEASVASALANYLSGASWGIDTTGGDARAWRNITTVRRFELIALVDRVPGVDVITSLTLAKQADALGTSDVTLPGVAPLPSPGTITVTAS